MPSSIENVNVSKVSRCALIAVLVACSSVAAGCGSSGSSSDAGFDAGVAHPDGAAHPDAAVQPDGAAHPDAAPPRADAAPAPADFWDRSDIPAATQVMTFKFLNRTNGKLDDGQIFWGFHSGAISELHSIAEKSSYDMPANASGRMYFYLCPQGEASCATDPSKSKYFDFIEHTIGASQYNGNTTRVDAFGVKIAMLLHCADGFEATVGEDYQTFLEDRAATFQRFIDEVPAEFEHLAKAPFAPYRIVEPGAGEFKTGGLYEHYYDSFVDALWAANGITVAKPGPNGSGLGAEPNLSAAIFRHVGAAAGTFTGDGKLANQQLWANPSTFYSGPPANYYAKFWHDHGISGKAYGFPYDDVGSYSTYISRANPQYMIVAIGW